MEDFKFNYNKENDDIFIYPLDESRKSNGAVELGNFIVDFDEKGDLVAIQILNFSEVVSRFFSKIKDLSKIKGVKAEVINFRNIDGIKFSISTDNEEESANFLIPHIKEKSPVL